MYCTIFYLTIHYMLINSPYDILQWEKKKKKVVAPSFETIVSALYVDSTNAYSPLHFLLTEMLSDP